MISGRSSNTGSDKQSYRIESDDSDSDCDLLEESPCGRWLKRKEEVDQREVPGIDSAHLAMDTEEGVEVVWNEVQFSERRNFKQQEEKIQLVFENLTQLEHPNIVKFHRYWTDTHCEKPRVIFITEYMSSGSLKQFLKKTKRNVKRLPLKAWKRWCTQILSALSYLHSCTPPIIHGNLTCDTIFIQHNGLVKIGSVAPDAINVHVKTCRDNLKNIHFLAPEYGSASTPAIDVYSFGMCALEMAALEIQGNGDSGSLVTEEHINRTIESLDDAQQKDFISKCLCQTAEERPSARELLFHPVLFEVHSLKLLAADCVLNRTNFNDSTLDEVLRTRKQDAVLADIPRSEGPLEFRISDVPSAEKLEKFLEDVRYGIYPLTAYSARQPPPPRYLAFSPMTADSVKSETPDPVDIGPECRKVVNMICSVKPSNDGSAYMMTILLRLEDQMNRQLTCQLNEEESSDVLAQELVELGFINEGDRERVQSLLEETLLGVFEEHAVSATASNVTSTSSDSTTESKTSISYHQVPVTLPSSSSVERCWKLMESGDSGNATGSEMTQQQQQMAHENSKRARSLPSSPMQEVPTSLRIINREDIQSDSQKLHDIQENQEPHDTARMEIPKFQIVQDKPRSPEEARDPPKFQIVQDTVDSRYTIIEQNRSPDVQEFRETPKFQIVQDTPDPPKYQIIQDPPPDAPSNPKFQIVQNSVESPEPPETPKFQIIQDTKEATKFHVVQNAQETAKFQVIENSHVNDMSSQQNNAKFHIVQEPAPTQINSKFQIVQDQPENSRFQIVQEPVENSRFQIVTNSHENSRFQIVQEPQENSRFQIVQEPVENSRFQIVQEPHENSRFTIVQDTQENPRFQIVQENCKFQVLDSHDPPHHHQDSPDSPKFQNYHQNDNNHIHHHHHHQQQQQNQQYQEHDKVQETKQQLKFKIIKDPLDSPSLEEPNQQQ